MLTGNWIKGARSGVFRNATFPENAAVFGTGVAAHSEYKVFLTPLATGLLVPAVDFYDVAGVYSQ